MSVSRFLSKRDKNHKSHFSHLSGHARDKDASSTVSPDQIIHSTDPTSAADFYGLFNSTTKSAGKDEEPKIKSVRQKVASGKGIALKDGQILWALRSLSCNGDVDCAVSLLTSISDSAEGLVTPFNPNVAFKGAVNRQAVTCYLDATLFSIFSRLDSFEAMLYNDFEDVSRQKLAFLLRLWVNLLRAGKLITTDITKEIQLSLAECGWEDAKELEQQDASEAFTFITEKLNLPLLTLKMDIFHNGKQDNDDHKFINERILEVGIPTDSEGRYPDEIKLEDCLEEYFNNRIEVKRYLERRSTLNSTRSISESKMKGGTAVHVETLEIDPDMPTPLSSTPTSVSSANHSWMPSERPSNRHRAPSIIQEKYIQDIEKSSAFDGSRPPAGRARGGSVRKEVLMPAWQFFSLIPWYTDSNAPSNNAQIAAHFSSKRPVLGLCLKRYSYTKGGEAIRLDTRIDIPIEIGLPHFIKDDHMDDDGPLYGNFKLSLQSVVCHRGNSVNAGHYIALARSVASSRGIQDAERSQWLRFDDLAQTRVSIVDVQTALREETPYLLFYQVVPIDGDPGNLISGEAPPAYAESTNTDSAVTDTASVSSALATTRSRESRPRSGRPSFDLPTDEGAGHESERRQSSVSFTEAVSTRPALDGYRAEAFSEHKKSGSFNNGITKTISGLSGRGRDYGGDENSSASSPIVAPQIHVEEASGETTQLASIQNRTSLEIPRVREDRAAGVSRSRSKREKSRSRLLKSSKNKDEDPDRECTVM